MTHSQHPSIHRLQSWLIIGVITFAATTTPIAIRYAQDTGIPSLALVFIRLLLSSTLLTPLVFWRYSAAIRKLTRRDYLWTLAAGFWLTLNLLALFYALEYTSVLVTGILRRTTPFWIIMPEIVLLGAVFTWRTWTATAVSVIGVIIITLGTGESDPALGTEPFIGALLALFGALFLGIYLLIGRQLSKRVPPLVYSWLVFSYATVLTGFIVGVTRTQISGYSLEGYLWAIVVTIIAQYLGQISINIGLQRFSATTMSIILELSVVLGAIVAFFQFAEVPTSSQILGSILVVSGVVLASQDSLR